MLFSEIVRFPRKSEEMQGGKGGTDEELGDLESSERSLDDVGDAVAEGGDGVVGVLRRVNRRGL